MRRTILSLTPRAGIRLLLVGLLTLALTAVLVPGTPSPAAASTRTEAQLVSLINAERLAAGKRALKVNPDLATVARRWSKQMAADRRLYHRPNLRTAVNRNVTTRWTRIGENVAYTRASGATEAQLVSRIHRSFMTSSGHRANVLGDYNQVGVGIVVATDGTMWVTENFLKTS